jgi:hypothetical protein
VSAPTVYAAINAITGELAKAGIAKTHVNQVDDYKYRSIDDLLDRLAPLLAQHRLCVFPRALERTETAREDECNRLLFHVCLKVCFTLTSVDDGSSHIVEAYGEALDASDKATAKAMTAAYKSAMIQTFCIPLAGSEDPDRTSLRPAARTHMAEPVQGWEQWARDIEDIVSLCESEQAIGLVQERNRELLKSLGRERQDLYRQLGECFGARREALGQRSGSVKLNAARQRRSGFRTSSYLRRRRSKFSRPRFQEGRWRMPELRFPQRLPPEPRKTSLRNCAAHRTWVRQHRCSVPGCRRLPIDCAHVRRGTDGGAGLKPSDRWSISLCHFHHLEQHEIGEPRFEAKYELDLRQIAVEFVNRSPHRNRLA